MEHNEKLSKARNYLESMRMNYIEIHNNMTRIYSLLSNEKLFDRIYDEKFQDILNLDFNIDSLNMASQTLLFNIDEIKGEFEREGDFSIDDTPVDILDKTQTIIKKKSKELNKIMQTITPLLFYYYMKIDDSSILNSNTFDNTDLNYHYYNTNYNCYQNLDEVYKDNDNTDNDNTDKNNIDRDINENNDIKSIDINDID